MPRREIGTVNSEVQDLHLPTLKQARACMGGSVLVEMSGDGVLCYFETF